MNAINLIEPKRVLVLEENADYAGLGDDPIVGRVGIDMKFDYAQLNELCASGLTETDVDLLYIVAGVMFADRKIIRRGYHRARRIELTVPVHDSARWSSVAIRGTLRNALEFVTGDSWTFNFVQRCHREPKNPALSLTGAVHQSAVVIAYSGGLDSFAALRLVGNTSSNIPITVTAENRIAKRKLVQKTSAGHCKSYHQIGIPISLGIGPRAESSFRTRTFVFFAVAALAAKLIGTNQVLVPENGQGSLGPSIIGYGGEYPYRGTSPAFSWRVSSFLSTIWSNSLRFIHPFVWITKGQMLRKLQDAGVLEGWSATRSCVRDLHRKKRVKDNVECGLCANCLLSRMSLHVAGVPWNTCVGRYLWGNWSSPTIDGSINRQKYTARTTRLDEALARSAVAIHRDLAHVTMTSRKTPAIEQVAYEVGKALGLESESVRHNLHELIRSHHDDWKTFVEDLPKDGWIRRIAGGE
jgi:hypothetical protein